MKGRWKGILALLACAHCSASVLVAIAALAVGGASVPVVLGVRLDVLLIPMAGLSLFAGWLWWGHRSAARSCPPEAP